MQLGLLWRYHGPHYVNDSGRYLAYGRRIAEEWHFEHDHQLRYLGYPLFISFWLKVKAGRWGIVLGQMALSALATGGFYTAVKRLAQGSWLTAIAATAALVLWRDIQQFNAYLLTESLFTSGILLSFRALVQARTKLGWALLSGLLLLTALMRPNGFIVPVAAGLAGLVALRQLPNLRPFRLALVVLVAALPLMWFILNKLLLTFTLIETYQRGEIIYGYSAWVVRPTEPLMLPPSLPVMSPMLRLGYFIIHNPGFFARLALLKLAALFFSYGKSYYSLGHLVAFGVFIYPSYWLAWRGFKQVQVWLPGRVFLASVVLLQGLVVLMTVEDWDVRFLAPVLPCVFALAALGAQPWLEKLQKCWKLG
jgi:hypothetical protein